MITDQHLRQLVDQGKLIIDPYDPRCARAGKYDVHLGGTILVPQPSNTVIDPLDPTNEPIYTKADLTIEPYILEPGRFILAQTQEKIGLAADIAMLIDGTSTLARLGLTIHQSATYIPAGQDPHIITLEIFNAGVWRVKLTYTMRVGKLITFLFTEANQTEARSFNPYNGQDETAGARFAGLADSFKAGKNE